MSNETRQEDAEAMAVLAADLGTMEQGPPKRVIMVGFRREVPAIVAAMTAGLPPPGLLPPALSRRTRAQGRAGTNAPPRAQGARETARRLRQMRRKGKKP